MPYFTRQVAPDGKLLLIAFVGVSEARRKALSESGLHAANPIQIQALIDTGASCTCVDPWVVGQLELTPTGSSLVSTPTTGNQPVIADQYDVSFLIPSTPGQPLLFHHTIPVLETELLLSQGFHALIGRDILRGCLLVYDGKTGLFSLAF